MSDFLRNPYYEVQYAEAEGIQVRQFVFMQHAIEFAAHRHGARVFKVMRTEVAPW